MTRKTNSTRKARKTRNRKPLNLKNLRTMWRKANPIARIGMVATATVAAIAAIAIIVGQYDFNPGNIISDGTFFNGNALSEQQVSTIIEQQGVACSGERCLKSMTFSTESQSADEYCQAYDGGPNESAAAIVYKAGKACGISQKVLTDSLRSMEADGIITRTVYPEVPPRVEYSLTELGESMRPILNTMADWGSNYKRSFDTK